MQPAQRTHAFGESTIREMTRMALQYKAINLSQGFPDFDPPPEIVNAAINAMQSGANQYAITWGVPALREKLAAHYRAAIHLLAERFRKRLPVAGTSLRSM